MENPEEGPRPPQHFIRHVVERSGPHENISEAERRERLTTFVNNQDRPFKFFPFAYGICIMAFK